MYNHVQKYIQKAVQAAVEGLTAEQVLQVCKNFRDASYGQGEVTDETMTLIGVQPFRKEFNKGLRGWETFCYKTYLAIMGVAPANCTLRGTGFRSQWFGSQVIEAIRRRHGDLVEMSI